MEAVFSPCGHAALLWWACAYVSVCRYVRVAAYVRWLLTFILHNARVKKRERKKVTVLHYFLRAAQRNNLGDG